MSMNNWKYRNEESGDGDEAPPKIISIERAGIDAGPQGNKIYFYSEVTREAILNLNKQIDELSKQMKIIQYTFNLLESPHIELHISSEGGDVFSAISTVDKIISNTVPVDTYCEGVVASAATLLSCGGHNRYITKNSCMLLHQISGGFWGSYSELKDEHANFELIMKLLKNIYLKKTKFKSKELDELLNHDLYLTSDKCLEHGLVDIIL